MSIMQSQLIDRKAAAAHCGVPESYLAGLAKHRNGGPAFVRISSRKTLYPRIDLDRWMATWDRIEPQSE
jgi:hypothetical protein